MSLPKLLIATQNLGKFGEFREELSKDFECVQPSSSLDVVEDGTTYYENALKKAVAFQREFQIPALSDDSGLEIDALNGEPGLYSARFGGVDLSWPERWDFLYKRLEGVPSEKRTAHFFCVLCYFDGKNVPRFFPGKASGRITDEPIGKKGFGYDPLFHSNLLGKTFGEVDSAEKYRASHRSEAIRQFQTWWKSTHRPA